MSTGSQDCKMQYLCRRHYYSLFEMTLFIISVFCFVYVLRIYASESETPPAGSENTEEKEVMKDSTDSTNWLFIIPRAVSDISD